MPIFKEDEIGERFGEERYLDPFQCCTWDLDYRRMYYGDEFAKRYLVEERINSVEVMRDTARWEEDGERFALVEDVAIVIRTTAHTLCLSEGGLGCIRVQLADSPDADIAPAPEDYWLCNKAEGVSVERETITL